MNSLLLTLSLLFGLLPFNRKNPNSNVITDYKLMAVIPLCYLGCYFMVNFGYGYGIYQIESCNSICRLGNRLFMHFGCFLYVSVYVLALMRRKLFYLEFENRLQDIDDLLHKCEKAAGDKKKVQPKNHIYYITWLLVSCVFVFDLTYDIRKVTPQFHEYSFISVMVISFPFFAGSIVQAQFMHYVSLISLRFTALNILFDKINHECDKKNAPISVFDIETDAKNEQQIKSKSPLAISDISLNEKAKKGNDLDSDSSNDEGEQGGIHDNYNPHDDNDDDYDKGKTHASDGHTTESNLPNLFKLHDKILSLSVITNAEFGTQCVPYMAACFAITIFGIFLETKVIFIVAGVDVLLDYVVFMYAIWSFTTMMVAYLVLRLCCNTNAHSKTSAMLVHEIMQKKPTFMLGNDLYYNKMKAFTLQYLHWEGYFQFNGIGLFALDYTFIFSTVSAATSYLIVLLQFDMTSILKSEGLM